MLSQQVILSQDLRSQKSLLEPSDWLEFHFQGVDGYYTVEGIHPEGGAIRTRVFAIGDWASGVRFAEELAAGGSGVYFRTTALKSPPLKGRGGAELSSWLPACFVELDLDQAKPGYPSVELVAEALGSLPLPPTAILSSGNGVHCYWHLKPVSIDDNNRKEVAAALKSWEELVHSRLQGRNADPVAQLSRLLRLPGFVNTKAEVAYSRQVRVIHLDSSRRYELGDLRALDPTPQEQKSPRPAGKKLSLHDREQRILAKYVAKARRGNRNEVGYKLFQQFFWNEVPVARARELASEYVAAVADGGSADYTLREALASVESAYGCVPRAPWASPQQVSTWLPDSRQTETISLDELRRRIAAKCEEIAGKPGVFRLSSGVGSGKSFASGKLLASAGRSVEALPTHKHLKERAEERLQGDGLVQGRYIRLEDHCSARGHAANQRAVGLPPCQGCTLLRACKADPNGYQFLRSEAEKAGHKLMTHDALKVGADEEVDFAFIDEDALGSTTKLASVTREGLEAVKRVADYAKHVHGKGISQGELDANRLLEAVSTLAGEWIEVLRSAKLGDDRVIPLPQPVESGPWKRAWAVACEATETRKLSTETLYALLDAATGKATRATLLTNRNHLAYEQIEIVVFSRRLPNARTILLADATAPSAEELSQILGVQVTDITPEGEAPDLHGNYIYPSLDITKGAEPSVVWERIMGFFRTLQASDRVSLFGHREHLELMMGDGDYALPRVIQQRVSKVTYFGEGPDVGSNDFHEGCDVILKVGSNRPDTLAVKRELVRRGDIEALTRDPQFGSCRYPAIDLERRPVEFDGLGYGDSSWAAAFWAIGPARCEQNTGRGRTKLPEGKPVHSCSSSPVPGAIVVPAYDPVPLEVGAAMAALKAAGGRVVKEKPKLDSLTWDFPKNTLPQSHDTKALAEIALHASSGWTEERLKSWLVRAEALGLVTRPRGERSGWAFTEAGYSLFFAQESESRAEVATEAGSVYSESSSCQARGSIEVAPPVAVTSDEASITHALADEGPREEGCGLDPVEAFATAVRQMGVGGHASATTCSASASALGWAEIVASLSDEKPDESPPPASYHGCPIPRQIERVGPIPQG